VAIFRVSVFYFFPACDSSIDCEIFNGFHFLIYGLPYGNLPPIFQLMATKKSSTSKPTARVGWNNRSQTVTMPLEYRFPESVSEVFIRREGESVVLTPRPSDWSGFFASGLKATDDFMSDSQRLPIQERTF
jgi:antitoxin VapB